METHTGNEGFIGHDDDTYLGRQRLENGIFHTEYFTGGEWKDTQDRGDWTNADICRALGIEEAELKREQEKGK